MHYSTWLADQLDWSQRGDYIASKHGIRPAWASAVLADPDCVVIDPDYNSKSGRSVRIIGLSPEARAIVTVIVTEPRGRMCGVNAWESNSRDQRIYEERKSR
ncbi:MAG: hypothetical protein Q7T71_06345 [Herbiconiux sp.]|nr:hypothetical protein [Herbiconiux sp.]